MFRLDKHSSRVENRKPDVGVAAQRPSEEPIWAEVEGLARISSRSATNLHELGVPDKVIQAILRHEDVSTTQRSYIKTVPQVVTDAMNQLEARIARAAVVQQVAVN